MKSRFASRSRTLLPLAVALSLITSIFSFAPSALAGAPTIALVSPSSGTTAGGTTLTITGNDFQTAPGFKVIFDAVDPFTYSNLTNTSFTLMTPPHAAGTVVIHVHTDLGDPTATYTYVTPVTVHYLSTGSDGGAAPVDNTQYMPGDTVIVKDAGTLVKTGYTLTGWTVGAIDYPIGGSFVIHTTTDLTPIWTPNGPHTVIFNSNFGTPTTTTQSSSVATTLTTNGFTRTGYTFNSWNSDPNGGGFGIQYLDGASYSFAADMTIYAQWTQNPIHTVTFNSNYGTPSTSTQSSSVATTLTSNGFTRPGYTFGSWNTDPNGGGFGVQYLNGASYSFASDMTIYAQWIPYVIHTVTFNSNYGTPSTTTQNSSVTANLTANTFTRTGYTFNSWNTDPNGGGFGIHYLDGASYGFTADMTVYAQWTPIGAHTVTFNSNYGTIATSTQTSSVATTLTANGFTRTGYTFNSWNTDPNGGGFGIHYLDGASYGFAADMTVYAQWTPIGAHTVTFNSNYGTPTTSTQTSSVTANLTANAFTRTGYTFNNWNTDPNGGGFGVQYLNSASYSFAADITVYAQWIANGTSFTITYLGNGNTSGLAPNPTTGSGSVNLATNSGVLVKTSSTFGGWNTAANGLGTTYAVGSGYNLIANITLYAIWITGGGGGGGGSITYTITYIGNGNTSGFAPIPTTGSGSVTLATNSGPLLKTGYIFSGWNTATNGLGTSYAGGVAYNLIADVALYAKWTAIAGGKFTITYDGNGNTGGLAPIPTVGSGAVSLAHNIGGFVKAGSAFIGWNSNTGGTGTSYTVGANYNLIADVTLYAAWTTNSIYTITYSGNGNTGGTVPNSVTGSGTETLATNSGDLVKSGYNFVGWNTYANGLGTLRLPGSTYLPNSNVTMYADFVPATVSKNVPSLILKGKIVVTAPPKKIALNQIVPVHQQFLTKLPTNAVGFELYENGKFAIRAKSNSVFLKQIVGPRDQVTVLAVGKDGTKSAPSPVMLSKDPISLANINFNTDSYQFIGIATQILDKVAAVMIQHGYTHLDIWGYVDTQGSKASWVTLSNNRAKAVNNYMANKLMGTGIIIKNAGRAQTQAVGNNNTAEGRALNRRVEIRVS
jgi:uncharacterized repeat protein (TIGR02543 family)